MCQLYVKTDPILYESRSRTIRIHGVVTSIRLENLAWDVLTELAAQESMTTNQLIATLHDEMLSHRGEVSNFASFLRITCLRYLRVKYENTIGHAKPLLNSKPVLAAAAADVDLCLAESKSAAYRR
jgi:predicted DNA-binding ribbon-helix-helix protein